MRADAVVMLQNRSDQNAGTPYSSCVQSDPRFAGFTPGRFPVFGAGLPDGRLSAFCAMRVTSCPAAPTSSSRSFR